MFYHKYKRYSILYVATYGSEYIYIIVNAYLCKSEIYFAYKC